MKANQLKTQFKLVWVALITVALFGCSQHEKKHQENISISETKVMAEESITNVPQKGISKVGATTSAIPKNLKSLNLPKQNIR